MHVCMYVCMYVYACMSVCMSVCMHACMHVCVYGTKVSFGRVAHIVLCRARGRCIAVAHLLRGMRFSHPSHPWGAVRPWLSRSASLVCPGGAALAARVSHAAGQGHTHSRHARAGKTFGTNTECSRYHRVPTLFTRIMMCFVRNLGVQRWRSACGTVSTVMRHVIGSTRISCSRHGHCAGTMRAETVAQFPQTEK